jgi:hypothetical protein
LLSRAHSPPGAPERRRRQSNIIAEKDEHSAGHYPGGGAGQTIVGVFYWWPLPSWIWAASKSFGFATGSLPDRPSNLPRVLSKPSFARREARRPRVVIAHLLNLRDLQQI